MQNRGRREGFDYFVDKSSYDYDNDISNQPINSYNYDDNHHFNSNGNSFLQNKNNFEVRNFGNTNRNYGLEYQMQPYSQAPSYPNEERYYTNGYDNNENFNINRRSNNMNFNGMNRSEMVNNRMDGTIEFSAFPGQGGLNPNERPLGDQTLMFSTSDLPSYNRNNNVMANKYVEQIIKTQQIQLNEQNKEINRKFDNIDLVLNNISKKVDNVNRTIANTATLSFNNNNVEEYDSNPYLDSNNKKNDTVEMTQHLKTSVLNDLRSDYENDVVKFKQQQIDLENKENLKRKSFVSEEKSLPKNNTKNKQKKGFVIGLIIFLALIVLAVVLVLVLTFGKVIK